MHRFISWYVVMNRCARNDSEHSENATHVKEVHWGYEGDAGHGSVVAGRCWRGHRGLMQLRTVLSEINPFMTYFEFENKERF